MLSYALGRQLEYYDEPAIRKIVTAVSADEDRMRTLILEIVNSYPFQFKMNEQARQEQARQEQARQEQARQEQAIPTLDESR